MKGHGASRTSFNPNGQSGTYGHCQLNGNKSYKRTTNSLHCR